MIEYIKIEGYKSIKKMELELRPINILIGGNGSGKSNFISFFKLLAAVFNNRIKQYLAKENSDKILYFGRKRTERIDTEISLKIEKNTIRLIYNFTLESTSNGYSLTLFDSVRLFGINDLYPVRSSVLSDIQNGAVALNQEEALLILQYNSNERIKVYHFHDTSNTSYLRRACDVADNSFLRQDGRNLPAFLYYLQEKHIKAFNLIVRTIQAVAPYIDRFILQPSRLNEKEIELRWIDTGDLESNFSAYELSDGTLRFIALTTLLLQPQPPEVVVIDEPALGLHPFAIGKLAGMIQVASAKAQIIAATQSPGLISQFTPEDVVVIDKSKQENQSVFKRLDSDSLNRWLQDYTLGDLWERNIINAAQPFIR